MTAMNEKNGRKLSKFKNNVGCWVYGPASMFPGTGEDIPKEIQGQGLVRAGFMGEYLSYGMGQGGKDMLVTIEESSFLARRVKLHDFNTLDFNSKGPKEGIILCEHTSRNVETGQSLKTASQGQSPQSGKGGGATGAKNTTKVYA